MMFNLVHVFSDVLLPKINVLYISIATVPAAPYHTRTDYTAIVARDYLSIIISSGLDYRVSLSHQNFVTLHKNAGFSNWLDISSMTIAMCSKNL